MTPKQRVIERFPKAVCLVTNEQNYWVISDPDYNRAKLLGEGDSFGAYRAAWANAAKKLKR
jgi:hypothetical protein